MSCCTVTKPHIICGSMRDTSKSIQLLTTRSEDDGHEAFQRAADAMLDTLQEELEVRSSSFAHAETNMQMLVRLAKLLKNEAD